MSKKFPPPKLLAEAESGNAESQYTLAAMFGSGEFILKNDVEAVKWYRKAAEGGHAEAQRNLGLMYIFGEGMSLNLNEGLRWLRIAGECGSAEAMRALALAYQEGLYGVEKNSDEAKRWSDRADRSETK